MRNFFPAVIPFAFPGIEKVRCYFTTGHYGNISLEACQGEEEHALTVDRRKDLGRLLGFSVWTELRQVHGALLLAEAALTSPEESSPLEADGLATKQPGHALLVKAADCQPILLAHVSGDYVAALHCGWRGNTLDFPAEGLAAFCLAYSLKAEEVLAVRGPSLGPGGAEFVNFDQEWPERFRPWFNQATRRMDLWSLTKEQLLKAGMRPEHIFSLDLCTAALGGQGHLFSFRLGHAQRQGALIFIG